jgi:hypothetical protein
MCVLTFSFFVLFGLLLLVVLGFELRISMLPRLYHLSHNPQPCVLTFDLNRALYSELAVCSCVNSHVHMVQTQQENLPVIIQQ